MNLMSRFAATALSVLVVHLAGCAGQSPMTGEAQTAAYREGFADGCQSGRAAAGSPVDSHKKNTGRFGSDKEYAQGWSAGFERCESEQTQKNAQGGA